MLNLAKNNLSMPKNLLSVAEKQAYDTQGFLVLEHFINKEICELLIARTNFLIQNFDPQGYKTIFSSADQSHAKSNYFLDSGYDIRFFFESAAIDEQGNLLKDKMQAINKIGHALHDLDPVFHTFSRMHKFAVLAKDLEIEEPLLLQSMIICKQAHIGGEVFPHQDSTYLHLNPEPVTGFWLALEDATLENGCLWAMPGGHKTHLKQRFIRDEANGTQDIIYDEAAWDIEKMQALPVKQGSLIVLHGLCPHMSKANKSNKSRYAYTLHLGSAYSDYAKDNWLQRPDAHPFRGFF